MHHVFTRESILTLRKRQIPAQVKVSVCYYKGVFCYYESYFTSPVFRASFLNKKKDSILPTFTNLIQRGLDPVLHTPPLCFIKTIKDIFLHFLDNSSCSDKSSRKSFFGWLLFSFILFISSVQGPKGKAGIPGVAGQPGLPGLPGVDVRI